MPRRKRHTKLPNGYGNISFLGKNRRRPYAVYPPCIERHEGTPVRPKALGYCETYEDARELLAMYHKGLTLPDVPLVPKKGLTFAEVYERYYADKYNNAAKEYSIKTKNADNASFKHAAQYHDRDFKSLTYPDLQSLLDACPYGYSCACALKSLIKQMYKYAEKYKIVDADESRHLEIRIPDDNEHGIPFTDNDMSILWREALQNASRSAKKILLMIYSGFRVSAYKSLTVRFEDEWYFQGGVKTKAGKDRIVPIHTCIRQIAKELYPKDYPGTGMAAEMHKYLPSVGIADHTPHDCRHTFSMLCERSGMPEADRKRLMGHSFGADITNGIYGHRTVEELRRSIEMIQPPEFVANLLRTVPE